MSASAPLADAAGAPASPRSPVSTQREAEGFRISHPDFELSWGALADGAAPIDPTRDVPRLREQTAYPVYLRSTRGEAVALEHRDPVLLRAMRSAEGGRAAFGTVDFGAQVGRSALAVRVGDGVALRFSVEVVPTKLDYERDYRALVEDVEEVSAALVLEWLRPAARPGHAAAADAPSRLEWALLLRGAAGELERALDEVARRPRAGLGARVEPARAERVRRPDAWLHRGLLRGAGHGEALPLECGAVRAWVEARRPRDTLDTPEHRWLAARLREARRRLDAVRAAERARPRTPRRERVAEELDALAATLARLARTDPLAAAAGEAPPGLASPQLVHAPGYAEAHRALRRLSLGLRVRGGPAELEMRDLHLLYEQWCWLALARMAAEAAGAPLPAAALLMEEGEGLRMRLRRGRRHAVRFRLADGGRLALVYEPRFGGARLLVPQRPDFLLEVRRPGERPRRIVLDAKYRVDASPGYVSRYGAPGPPEDALNTLHRYRDALRADLALALFPARDDDGTFRETRLWKSIEQTGIGAVPMLPGTPALTMISMFRDAT